MTLFPVHSIRIQGGNCTDAIPKYACTANDVLLGHATAAPPLCERRHHEITAGYRLHPFISVELASTVVRSKFEVALPLPQESSA